MKKAILLIFCMSSIFGLARNTKGKVFWVGFMENISLTFNGPPLFRLHISSDVNTTCTITIPFTSYSVAVSVGASQVTEFTLPAGNFNPLGDEAIANNGIRISSGDSIEVKAFHHRIYFTESTIVLPIDELGVEYLVTAVTDNYGNSPSEFMVLATQNSTTVEITPSAVTLGTRPVGIPFVVVLQQGQMYQIQSYGDLSGTTVKSLDTSKKIAVYGGARQAAVGCNSGADSHVFDQLFPVSAFGTKYNIIPFSGRAFDVVKILASQNNTSVTINGSGGYWLNKGQHAVLPVSNPTEIAADQPIGVTQISTSQGCNGTPGDPGMISLTSEDLTLKRAIFFTTPCVKLGMSSSCFSMHRVNVVVKASAIGNLKFDNTAIPSGSFSPVSSTSPYSYTRLVLDTLTLKQHTLTCDSGFNATVYAFSDYNFYGHHLGYAEAPPVNTTGIRTKGILDRTLILQPVPARDHISISSQEPISSFKILNSLGISVTEEHPETSPITVDLKPLPEGVYFCVIHYRDPNFQSRIVKFVRLAD